MVPEKHFPAPSNKDINSVHFILLAGYNTIQQVAIADGLVSAIWFRLTAFADVITRPNHATCQSLVIFSSRNGFSKGYTSLDPPLMCPPGSCTRYEHHRRSLMMSLGANSPSSPESILPVANPGFNSASYCSDLDSPLVDCPKISTRSSLHIMRSARYGSGIGHHPRVAIISPPIF